MLPLRSYSFIAILTFFSGIQSLYAMNSKELIKSNDVQKFFKPYLKGIVQRIDSNFKTLLEVCCYNPSPEKYKELCAALHKDFGLLVDFMGETMFDWNPDVVKYLCDEIEQQLVVSSEDSQFKTMARVITAWRMKNYLFDAVRQRDKSIFGPTQNYITMLFECFCKDDKQKMDEKENVYETWSLDDLLNEYKSYKNNFKNISVIQFPFDKVDTALNKFQAKQEMIREEIKNDENNPKIASTEGRLSWAMFNYVLPLINYGFFNLSNNFKKRENEKIIKNDSKKHIISLNEKIDRLDGDIGQYLKKNLVILKEEIKSLHIPALSDKWMLPHTNFLNILFNLIIKARKKITLYDRINNYNPQYNAIIAYHTMRGNFYTTLENALQSTQELVERSESSLYGVIDNIMGLLRLVNTADDLEQGLYEPFFNFLIAVFEQILKSETCAQAICSAGKNLFPEANIPQLMCDIKDVKKKINNTGLSLVDVKELIKLIGRDRVGIVIKIVLTMAARNPDNFKITLGTGVHVLVANIQNMLNNLKTNSTSSAFDSYSKALTQEDRITLLTYITESNTNLKNNNKNSSKIVNDVINGTSRLKMSYDYARIGNMNVLNEYYVACKNRQQEALDQYKRDEKLLMIRIIEENDWKRKQNLEQQLSNLRKRMKSAPSNNFMNKTYARYKELELLQQKYA